MSAANLAVHLFPVLGSFIRVYGSTEGVGDVPLARKLNAKISKQTDDDTWRMPSLHAAAIAWWIAEYSGLYAEDQQVEAPDGVDLDQGAPRPNHILPPRSEPNP